MGRPDFDSWVLTHEGERWVEWLLCENQRFLTRITIDDACIDYSLPPGRERDVKAIRSRRRLRAALKVKRGGAA